MRKFIGWVAGFIIGGIAGAVVAILFAPFSNKEPARRLKEHYHESWNMAREAGQQRRDELEQELQHIQGRSTSQNGKQSQ